METLADIQTQIEKLKNKEKELLSNKKNDLKEAVSLLRKHGITLEEIKAELEKPESKQRKASKPRKKKPITVYKNPKTGEEWEYKGFGMKKEWFIDFVKQGGDPETIKVRVIDPE